MPDDYATPQDIHAARPDLSIQTIHRLCRTGAIRGARKVGRSWIIPTAAAEEFVASWVRYKHSQQAEATEPTTPPVVGSVIPFRPRREDQQ